MSAVVETLVAARALIEHGWCQGDYRVGECVCSYGALQQAINGDAEDCTITALDVEATAFLKQAMNCLSVVSWNDARGRTQADVLAAFDHAIELARAAQGGSR